jgi:histidinol-phosphate aminotransferase
MTRGQVPPVPWPGTAAAGPRAISPAGQAADRPGYDLGYHGDADSSEADLNLAVNVRLPRPPRWLAARLRRAVTGLAAYPRQETAVAAVAARHGRDASEVLLTNGAAEAFTLLARASAARHAVCVHPAFTEPEAALRAAGHRVGRVLLAAPFDLAPELIPATADLVVVGNPTNPTGRLHPAGVLDRLARPGRILVVDEAFADAVPGEPATLSGRPDLPGVVVIRSLTKTWALAGLRVGYLLGPADVVGALRRVQPLWPVNALALEALVACSQVEAVSWAQQPRRAARWRASMAAALNELPGVATDVTGQAPFLLVRVPDAALARARLAGLGIAVRRCDTFPGLDGHWLRVAVPEPRHHARVAEAFARSTAEPAS